MIFMNNIQRLAMVLMVTMSAGIVTPLFAESAPVYDADSSEQQQQFYSAPDQSQDYPPPPPPGQEPAFVPNQTQNQAESNVFAPAASSTPSLSVEQRMQRLERQINNMQSNDTASRVESLQSQVQTLRDQVEQLTHQLQQLQSQQKSMFSDLDKRLSQSTVNQLPTGANTISANEGDAASTAVVKKNTRKIAAKPVSKPAIASTQTSTTVSSTTTTVSSGSGNQPNVAEEQQIYQTAYNLIKNKKYNEAVDALQGMLKKYPSGQFASNAHYWLGELYGLMNKNDQALTEFNTVVKNYSDSPRIADAQLKVGLILASQAKWTDAKAVFKKVINHYPGTASARLAAEQLKELKQAGH